MLTKGHGRMSVVLVGMCLRASGIMHSGVMIAVCCVMMSGMLLGHRPGMHLLMIQQSVTAALPPSVCVMGMIGRHRPSMSPAGVHLSAMHLNSMRPSGI